MTTEVIKEAELHMVISNSDSPNEVFYLDVDDIKFATLDPVNAYVKLETEDGKIVEMPDIDIVTYKILASLAKDDAFEHEFLS